MLKMATVPCYIKAIIGVYPSKTGCLILYVKSVHRYIHICIMSICKIYMFICSQVTDPHSLLLVVLIAVDLKQPPPTSYSSRWLLTSFKSNTTVDPKSFKLFEGELKEKDMSSHNTIRSPQRV